MARTSSVDLGAALDRISEVIAECSSVNSLAVQLGVPLSSLRTALEQADLPTTFHKLQQIYLTGAAQPVAGIDLSACIDQLPKIPAWKPGKRSRSQRAMTAIALISDIQLGEFVNPAEIIPGKHEGLDYLAYNMEIAKKRIRHYFDTILETVEDYRKFARVDELVIFLLGDLIEHSCLRENQTRFIEANAIEQTLACYEHLAAGIRMLAPCFTKIRVVGVAGNHGRLDRKASWYSPTENFDHMICKMLEGTFTESKHISFNVPDTWWAVEKVRNSSFMAFHGEDVMRFMNFPFLSMTRAAIGYQGMLGQIRREAEAQVSIDSFDYLLAGHHHTPANWESSSAGCEILMNGTFVPLTAFGAKALRDMNRAIQLMGFVDDGGLRERIPVKLLHVR